ncbi:hypothetical protein AZI86_04435 [Bdellovibrio bacteriovorus]|uniref:Uncharacterized protein n=1 Tax=Bdellovibrio bacteriovorus TaxID=959 RepID=A0A150WPF6_BDEBC|nr:hypothetical protein [Bdellovibrio bacteriovorus]KYG66310.1 hypothetical protein AZI86_04435 [Bdellovibrio bacteriovorus]
MKFLIAALISSFAFMGPAHAFISSEEQDQLLVAMNKLNPSQVHFQEVRCSARSRMCLVRMELGANKLPVGCAIERIASSDDLFVVNSAGMQLSAYSANALNQCIEGFIR